MATITNYMDWLSSLSIEDDDEVYSLFNSVLQCEEWGSFKTQVAKGSDERWIVSAEGVDESLRLGSQKAKDAFLKHIELVFCGELTMEGWYSYQKAMAKDD